MEFRELIERRKSIRSYADEAIDKELLAGILEQAQRAPSWKNSQTARCYAVLSPDRVMALRERALPPFNRRSSVGAALIVTTFVKNVSGFTDGKPDNELGNEWGAYDLGLHDAYLILAAADAGLDTLIMGIRDADAIREIMEIPEEEEIVSVIAVGKRAQDTPARPRKPRDEVTHIF